MTQAEAAFAVSKPDTGAAASRWPFIIVVAVALLAMGRAAGNDWSHFDDDLFLFRNEHYNPPTFDSLAYYWSHGFRGLWTPVTQSVWWLLAKIAILDVAEPGGIRLNPWMFHAANVFIHCMTSALAFVLLRRATRSTWPAIAGAIVFAAHPVQVEAVAWACGTKDLLAAHFSLATIVVATAPGRRWWSTPLAVVFAAAAMLSKPSAMVLPALLIVYAAAVDRSQDFRVRRLDRHVMTIAVTTALLAVPIAIIARRVQDVADVPPVALIARPLVALDALTMHLRHFVWPVGLCADYGLTPGQFLDASRRWWTWCVPAVLALLLWWRRDRILFGGAVFAFIALAPNLGLSSFQFQVYSTVADRYAYLAAFGIALVVARLIDLLSARSEGARSDWPTKLIAAALSVILVPIAFARSVDWHDASTLWPRVLQITPRSSLANNNIGSTLLARGELAEAARHFEIAAEEDGSANGFALLNLAQVRLRQQNADAAADAVVRLVTMYRKRAEFNAALEQQTIERFARELSRLDSAVAARMRAQLAHSVNPHQQAN